MPEPVLYQHDELQPSDCLTHGSELLARTLRPCLLNFLFRHCSPCSRRWGPGWVDGSFWSTTNSQAIELLRLSPGNIATNGECSKRLQRRSPLIISHLPILNTYRAYVPELVWAPTYVSVFTMCVIIYFLSYRYTYPLRTCSSIQEWKYFVFFPLQELEYKSY